MFSVKSLNFYKFRKHERFGHETEKFVIPSRFWCNYIRGLKDRELEAYVRTKARELFRSDSFYWTTVKQKHGTLIFMVPEEKEGILETYQDKAPLILHLPEGKYAIQTEENWLNVEVRNLENGDFVIEVIVFESPLENYPVKNFDELVKLAKKPKYKLKWSLKDPCKTFRWLKLSSLVSIVFLFLSVHYYYLNLTETRALLKNAIIKVENSKPKISLKKLDSKGNVSYVVNALSVVHKVPPPNWVDTLKISNKEILVKIVCNQPPCQIKGYQCINVRQLSGSEAKIVECKKIK